MEVLPLGERGFPDTREIGMLQLAYLGDTLHDLYARSLLLRHPAPVGRLHRMATRMVSAEAQAAMLDRIAPLLTEAEADAVRRGRNAQAKHAAPKHAEAGDYQKATALEALWGMLYAKGEMDRLNALMRAAFAEEETEWTGQG